MRSVSLRMVVESRKKEKERLVHILYTASPLPSLVLWSTKAVPFVETRVVPA